MQPFFNKIHFFIFNYIIALIALNTITRLIQPTQKAVRLISGVMPIEHSTFETQGGNKCLIGKPFLK